MKFIDLKRDGSFRLNMKYFAYPAGLRMTGRPFARLFDGPGRQPEGELTRRDLDLARSIQVIVEEALINMGRHVREVTGEENLCLAGGVALNCVANGKLLRSGLFQRLWIQPAAGDAGGALGAAYMAWHMHGRAPRAAPEHDAMNGAFLGPPYADEEIWSFLEREGAPYEQHWSEALCDRVAKLLAEQKVVGWFQGRMEYGP